MSPQPHSERRALQQERAELPKELARYHDELNRLPRGATARREWLVWNIRRVEKRAADVERWLAALGPE